ncbi:unnamed protein product [Litomosoides sigmodontis]|uniref:Uncharacterized protein n=1 Tax=Litomosoides sigmodontis TaxID=42156 RepID=A0A3P6TES8_LITSI|nr:unnamed protein product [Litomosoides sigmodontis]
MDDASQSNAQVPPNGEMNKQRADLLLFLEESLNAVEKMRRLSQEKLVKLAQLIEKARSENEKHRVIIERASEKLREAMDKIMHP